MLISTFQNNEQSDHGFDSVLNLLNMCNVSDGKARGTQELHCFFLILAK